jgi:calcineurin-like phosphoesterase family protein
VAVLFTADSHFGHGGALGLFARPFPSVAAMDAALAEAWNAAVAPGDAVWHLGDFAVRAKPERVEALLAALNGEKHLIAGNNDGPATRDCALWASVRDYAEVEVDGRRLVLCHYPLRSWNGMGKGALNLHGHSHGRLAPLPRQYDVGVDAVGFRPVTVEMLLAGRRRHVSRS